MRTTNAVFLLAAAASLMFGCFESTEDQLDGSVVDATAPCEDGAERDCVAEAGCLGTQVCSGGEYGECVPPDEVCDGVDNDCDGTIDEGFVGLGEACEGGEGKCTDQGRMVCAEDGMGTVCDAAPGDGSAEVCDGVDNDCDGEVDDDVEAGIECDTGRLGVCSVGATVCTDGDTICEPTAEAADEICDGLDNDCDGKIDEDPAGGALAESCYDGPEGTEGTGQCAAGVRFCTDGMWGECADQVLPGDEICDSVDNDCNGTDDDTGGECVCTAGETQPCYTGPEGTEGNGACAGGIQTCAADGSAWGACEGETVPGVELCDGADNDCNGDVDDAPGVGGPCVSGAGACEGAGELICDLESGQVVCDVEPGLPGDEICDGIDNDCDGVIDDVDGAGELCEVGVGACAAVGVQVCGDGGFECGAEEGAPSDEICDGIDNDCDGTVDDVEGVGEACEVGIGACRSTGITVCSPEGVVCGATEQDAAPAEFCGNGADDDCDGEADEPDCIIPCDGDDACGEGSICEDGACVPGDCRGDEDCLEGEELCEEGFCVPGNCRDDIECLDGEICDAGFCIVIPDVCIDTPVIDAFGTIEGSTAEAPSQVTASCGGGANSPENAYDLQLGFDGTICIDTFGSAYDTVLHLRGECARSGSETHCNDDTGSLQSQLEVEVAADGTYYVFVDGFGANSSGDYSLTVREGACGACTDDSHCPGDEFCAPVGFDGDGVCAPAGCGDGIREGGEQCDDGRNDDGDGCSARCEIEEGFDCIEPPEEAQPIDFTVDGLVNCGRPPAVPVALDPVPWPAWRAFYVGGAVNFAPADNRHSGAVGVAVDGEFVIGDPINERNDLFTPEAAEAYYAGRSSDVFAVPEGAEVIGGFFDPGCGDNIGAIDGRLQAVEYCFPTTCLADEDCQFGRVCVDGTCVEPVDSDGDGVADIRDVDDDNDGIPDAAECFAANDAQVTVINGSLEEPPLAPGANRQTPEADVPGWETTEGPGSIEMWGTGFLGVPAAVGNAFAEINAFEADGALYQDVATEPGTRFTWSFYHRGRGGPDELELRAGPPDATVAIATAITDNDAWRRYTGTYVVPEGQVLTRFEFRSILAVAGPGAGNFIDGVEFLPSCPPDADADGDGIPNSLDLDSDGDGILDADEAGHGLPNTDGVVDGEVGGNGLVDGVETVPDSGIINYEIADTDDNGVFDFLEPGPFNCGNGELGEDEECDDGNREDGDGCSIDCVVEPDWECVFNDEASVGPCADGQAVETVSVTPGVNLPTIGGEGGGPFDDTCPPGEVVIGFDLSVGPWGGFPNDDFITQSQAQCASFDVIDGEVVLAPTILTPLRGQTNNPVTTTRCPEGHVVSGYVGFDEGNAQRYVAGIGLVCSPVAVVDGRVEVGQPIAVDPVGNLSNEVGRFDCAPGQLVGANVGRSGGIIDQFTMRCDDIVEACRVGAGSVCEYQGECLEDADCEDGQLCRGNTCVQTGACPDDEGFGEPNDDSANATPVMEGRYEDLAVCGDDDWYTAELCPGGTLTVDVYFVDDDGDIDLAIDEGPTSTSTSDDEQAAITNDGNAPTTVSWRVYGFSGAENSYAMDVTVAGCVEACPDGRFPAECPEGFVATDDRTCEAQEQEPAVANGQFYDVCRAIQSPVWGENGVQLPGGGTIVNDPFFGNGSEGARLNTVGVWTCPPVDPINETIGFTTCFDLDAPGEYVIGIGADDDVVASIDGEVVFQQNGALRSWYLLPAVLSGGTHVLTMEGSNVGGPGGFGAEIYGPFPAGSTLDDESLAGLDYANNVAFTSLEQIGGVFDTGVASGYSCPDGFALDVCGEEPQCTRFERLDRCELAAVFCGNGEVEDGEECDDGNFDDDDGCSSECLVEGNFVCREQGFGIGVTDSVPEGNEPDWSVSEDGLTVVQNTNSRPATYSTSLPISVNYRAVFNVSVQTEGDDDIVGWTVGARDTPLSAPDQPYLIFSWKQLDQDDPNYGLSTAGLRVGLVDGPVTDADLWRFDGPITPLADGNRFGAVGWEDRRIYTIEVTGDADGLQVYVDGELEFDLDGPLPSGNLGFYTYSQNQYTAELISPLTLQICEELVEICDNGEDDDGDGAVDCADQDCNLDAACAVERTVYFSAPATAAGDTPGSPTRLYTVDGEGALQLLGNILLDGQPIPVSALALSPDGQLWGFQHLPGVPEGSQLLLIDPDNATAVAVGDPVDAWIDGAAFDPDGNLWVTDLGNQQVRPFDAESGLGPAVLEYPVPFRGADIAFDADGNCFLTGVDVPFDQFPLYSCDLVAGTAEALPAIEFAGPFDNGGVSTIPALAFAYDNVTCAERLYAFDSLSIDELGYIDLSGDAPVMTQIETTGINFSYYSTPDMAGFPSLAVTADCEGRIEICDNGEDDNGDGAVDCADPNCAENFRCRAPAVPDGELRLVEGDGENSGRLEVFLQGQWGTICDDHWGDFRAPPGQDLVNGDVACRQLGYPGVAEVFDAPPGVDPIWLDNVECLGDEARLADCPAAAVGDSNCDHGEDVGITCLLPGECRDDGQCADGDFCVDGLCEAGCVDDDDCEPGEICSDGECLVPEDFDGDGVPDVRDLDDDNDGILDTIECTPELAPVINSSFERPAIADAGFLYVGAGEQGGAFGWITNIEGEPVEIQARGHATAAEAALGRQYAEANAAIPGGFYQDVQTEPGTLYEWTMYHRGRDGVDTLEIRFGAPGPVDGLTPIRQVTSDNDAWTLISGTYLVPDGQVLTRLSFAAIASAGGASRGNFIDGFTFTPVCALDTDGDGVENSRDLDSDGDGINDADEAGHGQPNTDGVVDGEAGGNGVPDAVETSPDSSDANYDVADGNGDGAPDFLVATETVCDDGGDDDGDGDIDCDDADCALEPVCLVPGEICVDGVDNDDDGLIDCGDDDCRDDVACDIERTVYFSQPADPGNPRPVGPTRLYTLDSAGNVLLIGNITIDGQDQAVTAIALSPDGALVGFAYDNAGPTSTPITIDRDTGVAQVAGPPEPVHIHGAGFDPDGNLWVMDRTNQQVRAFGDGLGPAVIDYPIPMDGADIAFDGNGDCYLTGNALGGAQREIYRCDIDAGTTESVGAPQPQGFQDGGGRILVSGIAFVLRDDSCETDLFVLDGSGIDELGRVDLGVEPPVVEQIASTGVNFSWFINPDAAGFPSVANSPGCQGAEICDDRFDNDLDGDTDCDDADCALDPACGAPAPESEALCADGVDNDGDGNTDCEDNDCIGEPTCLVDFIACDEPISPIPDPGTYEGSTTDAGNDHAGTCGGGGAPEAVLSLFAARTATWCFDTGGTGFDTVMYARETDCAAPGADAEVACNDDAIGLQSQIEFRAIHGRTYYVFVDAFGGNNGDYVLNASRGACGVAEICDDGIDNDDDGDFDCDDAECAGVGDCPAAPDPACGDGNIDDGEECDDGNNRAGDGCSEVCLLEGGFACEQFTFGLGNEDELLTPGDDNPSEWGVSGDGFVVTQNRNSRPAHYSTSLPISSTYAATIQVGVRTDSDNDGIGWTIGATDSPLTDWQRPYLLFYWRQGTQDDDVYGLGREGLRVARINGPSTGPELNQLEGPNIELLAEADTYGDERWQDNTNYLVEIIGDGELLQVFVDGVLEFELADTGVDGNLGFFSLSQTQFRAELVSPRELQICGDAVPVAEVAIDGFAMNPDPVRIAPGQTVRWTNLDGATHTVTSGNPGDADAGALFDSGNLGQGETFEFTFEAPGVYTYFCRPHAGFMNGYQVIVGDPD